mmetsp:Transcript_3951/g.14019  ORF Transcript_3951/g.14019 Transcript_3951/m.14019 type:complete len:240 (-) Transcript_3951:633-1352(-)
MSVSPQGVMAVVRAARPTYRHAHDRVAFAVHAGLSLAGFRLLSVGASADQADDYVLCGEGDSSSVSLTDLPAEGAVDAPIDGWNSLEGGIYAFRYVDEQAAPPREGEASKGPTRLVLYKAVSLGDKLMVHVVGSTVRDVGSQQGEDSGKCDDWVDIVELKVGDYAVEGVVDYAGGYKALPQLCSLVEQLAARLRGTGDQKRVGPASIGSTTCTLGWSALDNVQPPGLTLNDACAVLALV